MTRTLCLAVLLFVCLAPAQGEQKPKPLEITLPPTILAATDVPTNIYFDNVVLTQNLNGYRFEVTCDSLTNASAYPNEVARLLSKNEGINWEMLGTQTPASAAAGVAHEGYGGWTWSNFVSKFEANPDGNKNRSSPFVFSDDGSQPQLNMRRYFEEKCDGKHPDYVVILLGINDCFSAPVDNASGVESRIDAMLSHADQLLDAIRMAAPKAQIGFCLTTPPNARQGAFEANYQDRYSRWGWKRIQHRLVQRELQYVAAKSDSRLSVVPTQLSIDPIDGYPANNGVHPNGVGYRQIGATIYSWLQAKVAESSRTDTASLLKPFWRADVVEGEPVLFVRDNESAEAKGSLLFPIREVLSVRSSSGEITYEAGRDYRFAAGTRQIVIPTGSRVVTTLASQLRRPDGSQRHKLTHRDGNGEILFGGQLEYHHMQTSVTYQKADDAWPVSMPSFDPKTLPETEFILVASMLGNRDWVRLNHDVFPDYRDQLASLCKPGIALADMTSVWTEFLNRKLDSDLTGNGVNHPNDFGHRVYAQVIASLLIDSSGVESKSTVVQSAAVRIAAHRGGYESDKADNAPENSVANIRNCQTKGYELYETDLQRTKDGRFVIMHDATIERETTGIGAASEMTLADLKKLKKRFRDRSVSQHQVATLSEFLVEGKDRVVFKADLKPGVNQYFKDIIDVVVAQDAMDGIVFRVPYRDAKLYADYRSAGVPYTRDLLMFMVSDEKQVDDIKKQFDPSTIQINVDKDDPTPPKTLELIRYAADQGMLVEVHAEGTEHDWQKLIRAGARMFHTSKPAKTSAFLRAKGLRNQGSKTNR